MKVLYISSGETEDYQCDALFHGLRELLGADAVDVNRIPALYEQSEEGKSKMYGRGYTLYANLPDIDVDRENIESKIDAGYFDLVFFGNIWRCDRYLQTILRRYPPSRVAFIDGEDETRMRWSLFGRGIYFKRELDVPLAPFIQPIFFAVPAGKFVGDEAFEHNLRNKSRVFAPCDPRDRSTYVFLTESAYYQQYQNSYFGVTMKKGGWDCMRHHEIVAQGTAPYFLNLENCPRATMHLLPREKLMELRALADRDPDMASQAARDRYTYLMRDLFYFYRRKFTTVALAEHVLRVVSDSGVLDDRRVPQLPKLRHLLLNARRNGRVALRKLRDGTLRQRTPIKQ
jgi:hypothetical protein